LNEIALPEGATINGKPGTPVVVAINLMRRRAK
jgi:hypothetical protein